MERLTNEFGEAPFWDLKLEDLGKLFILADEGAEKIFEKLFPIKWVETFYHCIDLVYLGDWLAKTDGRNYYFPTIHKQVLGGAQEMMTATMGHHRLPWGPQQTLVMARTGKKVKSFLLPKNQATPTIVPLNSLESIEALLKYRDYNLKRHSSCASGTKASIEHWVEDGDYYRRSFFTMIPPDISLNQFIRRLKAYPIK